MFTDFLKSNQVPRTPAGSMLREAVVRVFLAALSFFVLSAIGCLVLVALSPAKESWTGRNARCCGGSEFHGDFLLYCLPTYGTEALEDEAWCCSGT